MIITSLISAAITMITLIMIMVINLISKKSFMDREKMSPFECGFDPKSQARLPFSLQFFMIAIMFLIFDVEITLLFPLTITLKFNNPMMHIITTSVFIIILIIGLIHEWMQGALNWSK